MTLKRSLRKQTETKEKVWEIWEVLEYFGLYQKLQYFYICLPTVFFTMSYINYIFVVGEVRYRCRIPECEDANTTFAVDWWPNGTDTCIRPVLRDGSSVAPGACSRDHFSDRVEPCTDWVYEHHNSAISELGLACKPWLINTVGTYHNLGMMIAMLIAGWMSDRFGRKPVLIFSFVATFIGTFKMFTKNYYFFVAIDFLEALLNGGSYNISMLIVIEITGLKNRIFSGIILSFSIYMGEAAFAIIPMIFPYWKTLVGIIYIPSVLWISLLYLLYESPRWLVVNGKAEDAINSLERIAETNKLVLNKQHIDSIDEKKLKQMFNIQDYQKREGFKEIFSSKEMIIRLVVAAVGRFTTNFVYFGLLINSLWLPGNKYTNFLLATVMSVPGELISLYLMNKIGRKLPLIIGFLVCGTMCAILPFVPENIAWAKITLFLIGKMVVSACYSGAFVYCMELFPTSARGTLLGICACSARTGGMLAPLTPVLNQVSIALPPICFGAMTVLAGLLLTLSPETKDMPLMDTVAQAEASVRRPKYAQDNLAFTEDSIL